MKYNKVYYYDKNGVRTEFLSKYLDTKENIAALKEYDIWDDTETLSLTPTDFVEHKTRKSFFRAKPNQPNKLTESEESETHDLVTEKVYYNLKYSDYTKIWYKDFTTFPAKDKTLLNLQSYNWNFEVTRELTNSEQITRHDIYGTCRNGTLSAKRPEIIIEVIDSHFLDKDIFVCLRERTKQHSTVILFYFTENEHRYNKTDKNDLRISAFMKDGAFFYGGIQIMELTPKIQDDIQNKYLYYNQVNQYIIKIIRKGNKINISQLIKENTWQSKTIIKVSR